MLYLSLLVLTFTCFSFQAPTYPSTRIQLNLTASPLWIFFHQPGLEWLFHLSYMKQQIVPYSWMPGHTAIDFWFTKTEVKRGGECEEDWTTRDLISASFPVFWLLFRCHCSGHPEICHG